MFSHGHSKIGAAALGFEGSTNMVQYAWLRGLVGHGRDARATADIFRSHHKTMSAKKECLNLTNKAKEAATPRLVIDGSKTPQYDEASE